MITPIQVYECWPHNDLLPFDSPQIGESYADYRDRIGDALLSSDRLFHFTLAELCGEDIDYKEAQCRLVKAQEDLECVIFTIRACKRAACKH